MLFRTPKTIYPLHHGESFYPSFPSLFLYTGTSLTKGDDNLLATASAYYVTCTNLACDIISEVGISTVICYHTAALPCKRIVNKCL